MSWSRGVKPPLTAPRVIELQAAFLALGPVSSLGSSPPVMGSRPMLGRAQVLIGALVEEHRVVDVMLCRHRRHQVDHPSIEKHSERASLDQPWEGK